MKEIRGDNIMLAKRWKKKHLHLRKNVDIESLSDATHRDVDIDRFFLRSYHKVQARAFESSLSLNKVPVNVDLNPNLSTSKVKEDFLTSHYRLTELDVSTVRNIEDLKYARAVKKAYRENSIRMKEEDFDYDESIPSEIIRDEQNRL